MTFSEQVKAELCEISGMSECCCLAELSALIHTAGSIVLRGGARLIEIYSRSAIGTRLNAFLSRLYGCQATVSDNVYTIAAEFSQSVLTDCGILRYDELNKLCIAPGIDRYLVEDECCVGAYVRGCFLGGGSLSAFDSNTRHLEFAVSNSAMADDLKELLSSVGVLAGVSSRRGKFIVYVKVGEGISDILALMGATRAVLKFNEALVLRSVNNRINRAVNCDNANLTKTIDASVKQTEAILRIKKLRGLSWLEPELRALAEHRLAHEDASYEDIARTLGLKKSTVSYRLMRIVKLSDSLGRD